MMEYKITLINQIKSLQHLLYSSILMPFAIYFVYSIVGYTNAIPIILGGGYLITVIPTLFLHIEYYLINKNDLLKINIFERTIIINKQKAIFFKDIECITYFMPPVWHGKSILKYFSFEDYHFAKIKFNDGSIFIFTCLMAFPIENALENISRVVIKKRKFLFASTLLV